MADTTVRYLFLRIYSNDELCAYLDGMLLKGWVIDHCRGNFLFFRRQSMKHARLAVATTECTKRTPEGDDQVNEFIEIALRQGWQLLCIGDFESVIPMRRRLYFYTMKQDASPLPPDKTIDFQYAYRGRRSTLCWAIVWSLLAVAAASSTCLFMAVDGPHFTLILIDAALVALAVCSCFLYSSRRALYRSVTNGLPMAASATRALRLWEKCMTAGLAALFVGVLLLLFS